MAHRHAFAASIIVLGLTSPAGLAPAASGTSTTGPRAATTPTLTSVRARHVGDVDRVTFRFAGGAPTDVDLAWVDTLTHDGSGLPVRVAGAKVLSIVFHGADAHDQGGSTVRQRTAFPLPNVITAVQAGDFEGTVTTGLGVQKPTAYTVQTLTDRVVIDVAAGFATVRRRVWFVDRQAVATGNAPYVVPVFRPVPAAAPAAAVLHLLFAGPTSAETAVGLRLIRSHASGFDHLQVAAGIARLRLSGGCNSDGSTITVAGEIAPTLRQFPTVDWVKIYSPGGVTEQPQGQVDSIPACLEP
ncbi:MAG: hypothetical protein QOD98_3473 [Nocardioidaceae bacterium]|nr:hypothetical protein [Nocardioidaceae bacterium]